MGQFTSTLWGTLAAVFRLNVGVAAATFAGRTRRIVQVLFLELVALPVFALLGYFVHPFWHLLYGLLVAACLAYQTWCATVMYGLAVASVQFERIVVSLLQKLLAAASVPAQTVVAKGDAIKARFQEVMSRPDGRIADGLAALVQGAIDLLALPPAAAQTVFAGLDGFISEVQAAIGTVPNAVREQARHVVGPALYRIMSVQWYVLVLSGTFAIFPWWRNPTAALVMAMGGVLVALLLPQRGRWAIRFGLSALVVGIGVWGLAMPEQWTRALVVVADRTHTDPMYYRMVRESPRFYPTGADEFRPRQGWQTRPGEMVGPGTRLKRIEEAAARDKDGGLWIKVTEVDPGLGLPGDGPGFYIPLRRDYVEQVPTPGGRVGYHTYTSAEDYGRIDQFEGHDFVDFAQGHYGSRFSRFIWTGYTERIRSRFGSPLTEPYRIGSVFQSPLHQHIHQGLDLITTSKTRSCPVVASFDGVVDAVTTGEYTSITLKHTVPETPDTLWTHYGGLETVDGVAAAKRRNHGWVKRGDRLGTVAAGTISNLYQGDAFLHFVVMRQKVRANAPPLRMNTIDPLEPLQLLDATPVRLAQPQVKVHPYRLQADAKGCVRVPPNMPVCRLPLEVRKGERVAARVLEGSIYPDNVYRSKLNVPTPCTGLALFPPDVGDLELPVPGARYAALVVGVNGLQLAMPSANLEFTADRSGPVCVGYNEPVCYALWRLNTPEGPVAVDYTANNTGPGFLIKVERSVGG